MSISTAKAAFLGAALALIAPVSGAHAQGMKSDPDAMDVARTPLEDFNIHSKDIPDILVKAVANPYDLSGMRTCNDLVGEIAILDNTLGPDFDIPQEEGGRISAGRVAKSIVGSLVPFRGIVREVTGANKKRNAFELAVTAGMVRRAYLKGVGQTRGCSYPARPRDPATAPVSDVPPNIDRGNGQE